MEILKDLAPIKISVTALQELEAAAKQILDEEKQYLRVGVKNGGCAGFSYIMEFDKMEENDILYTIGNLNIITDKTHLEHISGMTIDYENGLKNRGFIYNNPNASSTCGCGTSFS